MAWEEIIRLPGRTVYVCGCHAQRDSECICDEPSADEPAEVRLQLREARFELLAAKEAVAEFASHANFRRLARAERWVAAAVEALPPEEEE